MRYCSYCGKPVHLAVPPNDDRPRFICPYCNMIHYQNPKMVVGCIPEWNGKILLCRRSIEPRYGKWTLPAGYLENEETVVEGAAREAMEEARVKVVDLIPFAVYSLAFVSQVYLMFRCHMLEKRFGAGYESLEVALFDESNIPWNDLSFTVIERSLKQYISDRADKAFGFHIGEIERGFPN